MADVPLGHIGVDEVKALMQVCPARYLPLVYPDIDGDGSLAVSPAESVVAILMAEDNGLTDPHDTLEDGHFFLGGLKARTFLRNWRSKSSVQRFLQHPQMSRKFSHFSGVHVLPQTKQVVGLMRGDLLERSPEASARSQVRSGQRSVSPASS